MTSPWRTGVKRLAGILVRRPDRIQRDADDEIAAVLEERVERLIAAGLSREAARAEALQRLGGSIDAAREDVRRSAGRRERAMRIREWLSGAGADLRYALRGLRREPLVSGFIVLTLALGIGANATMFGVVDRLLLRGPAHVRDASRVVRLYWTMRQPAGNLTTTAHIDSRVYANLEVESRAFSGLAMYTYASNGTLFGRGPTARFVAEASATANFMTVLGANPELGRFFTLDEQHSATPVRVAVLGYGFWQREFGGDRDVLGRVVTISSRPYTIVGVAPKGFTGVELDRVDVWLPLKTRVGAAARHWTHGHSSGPAIVGRLLPGMTSERAAVDATGAYRRTYDGDERRYADASIDVSPLRYGPDNRESAEARIARWLAGVSGIVLLVACANIINLLLARAVRRRREMAVRIALGAGRARLLRLLLASSLLLAFLGGVAALGVAFAGGTVMRHILLPSVDWSTGPVSARVLLFSLVVALIAGVGVGLVPALRAGRTDVAGAMKAGAREGGGRRVALHSVLMLVQATLAMLLLVGAGLFVRSLDRVRHVDLGFQPDRVVWLSPRWRRLPAQATDAERTEEQQRQENFARDVLDRLQAAPEVEHAAASIGFPFGSSMSVGLSVPGWDSLPKLTGSSGSPDISAVSSDYFATMGTRLLRGRAFTPTDRAGSELVAIVSETMARVLWPGREALGQCLRIGGATNPCSHVVGVVEDVHRRRIQEDPFMHYYVPLGQERYVSGMQLLVRPRGDAAASLPALRALVRSINPSISFLDATVLQDLVDPQTRSWRTGATMFSLFAGLALLVAAVGMFSIVAYLIEQRRHEISVRMALGAESGRIIRLLMRGAVGVTVAGTVIGAALALVSGRLAQPLLFETSARDPVVIGGVAGVLILVSLIASLLPALRARRIDPIEALREE